MELVVTDGWVVGDIIDNSESSFMDLINHCFRWSRWSLVWAILCKCFPSQEALLCAILARARAVYSSILAAQVIFTPTYLPSQMARSLSDISALSNDMNLYSVCVELCSLLLWGVLRHMHICTRSIQIYFCIFFHWFVYHYSFIVCTSFQFFLKFSLFFFPFHSH